MKLKSQTLKKGDKTGITVVMTLDSYQRGKKAAGEEKTY